MAQKISRTYAMIGILFLNTVLMFAACNVAAWVYGLFDEDDADAEVDQPTPNAALEVYWLGALGGDFDDLQEIYDYRSSSEIIWMLLETANLTKVCDDVTGFREPEYHGQYVNVHEVGFRYGAEQVPWPPDPDNLNIYLFGGSTAFGYGEADEFTISSHLQRQLREELGTDRVALYNFGRTFYISLQERWLFEQLVADGFAPDVAIFLDGLNDFFYWNGEPADYSNCAPPVDKSQRWQNTLTCQADEVCLPVQDLANDLFDASGSTSGSTDATVWGTIDYRLNAETPPADDEPTLRGIIERWDENRALIEATAQDAGVALLFVKQPTPFYAHDLELNYFYDSIEDFGDRERIHWGYQLWDGADEAEGEGENVLNLIHLGEEVDEPIYLDGTHYTIDFMDEIAAVLRDELLRRGVVG